jgi:hypothetical protein
MNTRILYTLTIGLLLTFTACEKEVTNIKLPQASSKLVVTSFISPQDTLLRVSVLESVPAIGKNRLSSDDVPNARVRMSDGVKTVDFVHDIQARAYVADIKDFPIIPGNTYFLEVSDTKGRKTEASCTVPVTQNIALEIEIDSAKNQYNEYMDYFMIMKWQDTPGEVNYYRIFAELYRNQGIFGSNYFQQVYFGDAYSNVGKLYSDSRLDGAKFSSARGLISKPPYNPEFPATNTLYAYLLNTDEHYYRYHQSLSNHYNTDGNPFAEPALIYSNINGGLGAFGSYTRTTVSMPLR